MGYEKNRMIEETYNKAILEEFLLADVDIDTFGADEHSADDLNQAIKWITDEYEALKRTVIYLSQELAKAKETTN